MSDDDPGNFGELCPLQVTEEAALMPYEEMEPQRLAFLYELYKGMVTIGARQRPLSRTCMGRGWGLSAAFDADPDHHAGF
jgi:hypothetical protein